VQSHGANRPGNAVESDFHGISGFWKEQGFDVPGTALIVEPILV
jgi:hypothetical protein